MSSSFRKLLKKIGWIASSELSFPLKEEAFLKRLSSSIDAYRSQGPFEVFTASQNDYFGKIKDRHFLMRRRRRMFDWTMGSVLVEGEIVSVDDGVDITAQVKFPGWIPVLVISLFVGGYGLAFVLLLILIVQDPEVEFWMMGLALFHAFLFGGLFYVLFRKAISSGKEHFEKDLKAMMKK